MMVHNVIIRVNDSASELSADLGACKDKLVNNHSQLTKDYNLNLKQMLRYLHVSLNDIAVPYPLTVVFSREGPYQEAID